MSKNLQERYLLRNIKPSEGERAAEIEHTCFPPNEACDWEVMKERAKAAPELFLVAEDLKSHELVGFINGLSTTSSEFSDDFFRDVSTYEPEGTIVMMLGVSVMPGHRGQGLASYMMAHFQKMTKDLGKKKLILTCLDDKVSMYEGMGFVDDGISTSSWGGEEWHEMYYMS